MIEIYGYRKKIYISTKLRIINVKESYQIDVITTYPSFEYTSNVGFVKRYKIGTEELFLQTLFKYFQAAAIYIALQMLVGL